MFQYIARAIASALTVIVTVAAYVSCGVPQQPLTVDTPVEGVPKPAESVRVSILQSQADIGQSLQQTADLFAGGYGEELRISTQTISNPLDYKVALRSRLLAGEQVDLFHLLGYQDMEELLPYLTDLSDLDWLDNAVPGSLDAVRYEDRLYGVPYSISGTGLIANRNIFEAAEIPLADIRTYQDLEDALGELSALIRSGALEEQFPYLESATELTGLDRSYLGTQVASVALLGEFSSPAHAAAAQRIALPQGDGAQQLLDLLARHSAGTPSGTARSQLVENGLARQRVAVVLEDVGVWQTINRLNPGLGNRMALLPIALPEQESGTVLLEVPAYWAVNRNADEQAGTACREFLTWLYREDTGAAVYANIFQQVSPFQDTARDTGSALHRQLLGYLEDDAVVYQYYAEFPQGWGDSAFAPGAQEFFSGEIDWAEATESWRENWAALR